jgi:chromosome segregation ATPase
LNHIASILEAHSQLLSNIQAGNELVSSEADSVNSRLQEMFASLLTGQHTMLDMFSELSETGDASRDELRGAILALRDLQTTVQRRSTESEEAHRALDAAQQELEGSKGGLREARTESEVIKQRLADVRAERDELRVGMEDGVRRLEAREQGERIAVERADHLKAMRMAAEDERDALAVALQRASGRVDTQEEKLRVLQSEVSGRQVIVRPVMG